MGRAALSPDGKRLAFLRFDSGKDETEVVVANADGVNQQKIASRKRPDYYRALAWSPDGNVIALSTGTFKGNYHGSVVTVPASGGAEHNLTTQTWYRTGQIEWLGDGSGLVLSATAAVSYSRRRQRSRTLGDGAVVWGPSTLVYLLSGR